MIVDAHAHIYSQDETAYPPIERPYRPPAGTGTPEGLRRAMRDAGVDRAMLVQTTTFYGWDNSFLRDTAAGAGDWAVGVCTLDPDDPGSPEVLATLVERANVRALRTYVSTGSAEGYPFRDLHGVCRRFVTAYGPDRCVWGSDYPTELWCPKTTYAGHLDLFRRELGLSPGEQDAILGETAARLYRLSFP